MSIKNIDKPMTFKSLGSDPIKWAQTFQKEVIDHHIDDNNEDVPLAEIIGWFTIAMQQAKMCARKVKPKKLPVYDIKSLRMKLNERLPISFLYHGNIKYNIYDKLYVVGVRRCPKGDKKEWMKSNSVPTKWGDADIEYYDL